MSLPNMTHRLKRNWRGIKMQNSQVIIFKIKFDTLAEMVRVSIINEVKESEVFAIMADETKDTKKRTDLFGAKILLPRSS